MNTKKRLTNLLAVVALGTGISMFVPTADAAPRGRNNDVREERREVKEEKKELKEARKDLKKADTPEERREAKKDVREERRDVKDAKRDVKEERRENRGNNYNWNKKGSNNNYNYNKRNPGLNPRYPGYNGNYNNGRYNDGRYTNNGRYNNDYRTFTGKVVDIDNGVLKVRIGNQNFDVFTNNRPRGLDEGDIVRIYGVRSGSDDIRNASVSIINNR